MPGQVVRGLPPNLLGFDDQIHRIVSYEPSLKDVSLADPSVLGFWTFFACEEGLYRRYNNAENPAETDEPVYNNAENPAETYKPVTCLQCMAR